MRYGYFDDARREYVITRPDTPVPWINYLGTDEYFGIVSNTAGGYSWHLDARLRRLTRYRYNNVPGDSGGRYLYLRDDASGEYWSPSWQPVRTPLDSYECRHGLSYTAISSSRAGIATETVYFVPRGENHEVWRLSVTNTRERAAEVSVFSSVEFALWDAQDDTTNFQRNYSTGEVEVVGGVIYHKTEYRERRDHFAYFACSEPLAGFETQREAFLGPYRGFHEPLGVERGELGNSIAHGWSPHGAHHVRLALQPGETREVVFLLGYWANPKDAKFEATGVVNKAGVKPVIEKWLDPQTVADALADLRSYWEDLLGVLHVDTPDRDTNRMVSIWNTYQCMVTFNMSRSVSSYETGISRGMGFRDSCQDLLGSVQLDGPRARQRIIDLAATQFASGGAYHQYQPLTKTGNDAIGSGFNDDPLWLVLGVAAYLKETGDTSILDETVSFSDGGEATLYGHLERSVQYTLDRTGPHGLPLIGRADWNDCLNLNCFSETPGESFQTTENREGGVAESVFIAGLFTLAARELAGIAALAGREAEAESYRADAEKMAAITAEHGWDGEWFLRAYDHFGNPVGSGKNAEAQIFLEPQGMCVMAGIGLTDAANPASGTLAERALSSVRERLTTPHGIMLLQPAFTTYHVELGEISSYPPGYKENASVFCHTNPWVMIAAALTGDGDAAYDYYRRINPSAREAIGDVHKCEPYVYAQMIAGRDAPTHGEAKNSWLTGTAAWNYVAITQWILGIRPELGGLRVDPVIPSSWPGFTATRRFRDATYQITVRRAGTLDSGIAEGASVTVNGERVIGTLLPLAPAGDTVRVEVVLPS
ncbi:glycosyl transferase [Trebonia kvetii]|uniref:Glycosyl transferase n=1 Tax=Trebonia kvetii TaxID=2480626 RepID=A0A6P2BU07_9ACTN|nr:glycosyl hydrolase family 65 protein [Trebonia kvetii]TVZ01851.1 glycosyl transferase [Trebonia kvetii]